jgi:hypothetical protein
VGREGWRLLEAGERRIFFGGGGDVEAVQERQRDGLRGGERPNGTFE